MVTCSRTRSDDDDGKGAVQACEITRIAGYHVMSMASRTKHHAGVDHVGHTGPRAELTSRSRHSSVQRVEHRAVASGAEEAGEPSLLTASAPRLG